MSDAAVRGRRAGGLSLNLPSIVVLFVWSVVPLMMTLWFSFRRYQPDGAGADGF